jgi:topoisomerase-4 subunit A
MSDKDDEEKIKHPGKEGVTPDSADSSAKDNSNQQSSSKDDAEQDNSENGDAEQQSDTEDNFELSDSGDEEDLDDGTDRHVDVPADDEHPLSEGEVTSLNTMFKDYWVDYASDVILDRSVPEIADGLKPVQRRILHAMKEMDDGKYNKVSKIVGATMAYHPHGDASIKDALVNLGQKNLLIDCQGNWGNILTGDSAAAGRYIEAKLSKFAKEVVFNPKTTHWKPSYDGRTQEPVSLPIKFPLLLAQGTKGIAVTLQSVILPYNFCELIDASIKVLNAEPFEIFPDFPTGGSIDVSKYNDGALGGRLRIRAKMHYDEKQKAIIVTEIPYGITTDVLIDSILKANEKGKIKVKKVDDNTADAVEVVIQLPAGVSPDQTIDALYAFTNCQITFSPQTCVIVDNKPVFMTVSEILEHSTFHTRDLLKRELEIQLQELEDRWHYVSLEKIFFEKRIYKQLEKDAPSYEMQLDAIQTAFEPYVKNLRREVTRKDVLSLCDKPVHKISKFDIKKAEQELENIEINMEEVRNHLAHLTDYAIAYFKHILETYGKGRERKTEIRNFEDIQAATVAMATEKLYANLQTGFAGYAIKREEGVEPVGECSKMDDIIAFRADGTCIITKVAEKVFVGSATCKELVWAGVYRRGDDRTVYNMIYRDDKDGKCFVKRFTMVAITHDREYILTRGTPGSRVLYFSANPNGEAEVVTIHLSPLVKAKKRSYDFDFSTIAIKGRNSMGNIVAHKAVQRINKKEEGISTLGSRKIWFDPSVARLNVNDAGRLLGEFKGKDKILTTMRSGCYRTVGFDLTTHFDDDMLDIRKYNKHIIVTAIYQEADTGYYYIKRFQPEPGDKKRFFLDPEGKDTLVQVVFDTYPMLELHYAADSGKKVATELFDVDAFISVKGYTAKGKRLAMVKIDEFCWLEAKPEPEYNESESEDDEDDIDITPDDSVGYAEGEQTKLFDEDK